MRGATLVVHEHKLYSTYVAHKHSRNISFTKLCETNQSHSGQWSSGRAWGFNPQRCGFTSHPVVALWRACARL